MLEKNEEYLEDEYSRPDAALTVISREQALRLFDEGKQIYLIRISPWPVLVTGREEIERGSDYFQIAKEDLEKDKQKVMENSEKTPVEKLAEDLDNFAFDFDFYHYKDSVEDREQAVEALKAYDKIPSERMNADKCIGVCIEEDGGFVGMYELVVNDKVQRENINSINYFRDDKLVQQAISDMEKLMAARQQSKEQERGSTKKSVLDALRSLKAKKQEQPAQEQDKPKKAKKKGMEL